MYKKTVSFISHRNYGNFYITTLFRITEHKLCVTKHMIYCFKISSSVYVVRSRILQNNQNYSIKVIIWKPERTIREIFKFGVISPLHSVRICNDIFAGHFCYTLNSNALFYFVILRSSMIKGNFMNSLIFIKEF